MHLIGCDRAFDKETCAVRQSAKELHCMDSITTLTLHVLVFVHAACGADVNIATSLTH